MAMDLVVLAIADWTDAAEVAAMAKRCQGQVHPDGEIDPRIAGFYERLTARFPDRPPDLSPDQNPWMDLPLSLGIDHVFMLISWSERGQPALDLVFELAAEFDLTVWDPQSATAHVPAPAREQVAGWWRDLMAGRDIVDRMVLWIEQPPDRVDDPITLIGLQQLHSFALSGRTDVGAALAVWLDDGRRHDANPERWQRDRYAESLRVTLRDHGPERARALGHDLVRGGFLPAGEVAHVLGVDE
jgi:hypothetical protein